MRSLIIITVCLAVCYQLWLKYWVYLPAIIDYIKYPLPGPNKPMIWKKPSFASSSSAPSSDQPNIIIILADDLGFNDISLYSSNGGFGNGIIQTPNIDSIGKYGIRFNQAYAGHATCSPARASLLTGKYPTKVGYEFTPSSSWASWVLGKFMNNGPLHGIYHKENAKDDSESFSFPLNHQIIPELLSQYGYNSIQFGKWHNGYDAISAPINRGFNESLGFNLISSYLPMNDPNSINCYFDDTFDRLIWANVRYGVKANNGKYFQPQGYITDYLAHEVSNAIDLNKNNPFFMYVAMSSIHTPLQSLKSDYETCQELFQNSNSNPIEFNSGSDSHCNCVYGGMILALDRAVGTILNSLEKNNLTENTIVLFTSDNGGTSVVNQRYINSPYRGWKATFFEGGLRVPFLVKWPKYIPQSQINDDIVSHVDILPTLVHAATVGSNQKYTKPDDLDGISLLPFIIPSFESSKSDDNSHTNDDNCTNNENNENDGNDTPPSSPSSPSSPSHPSSETIQTISFSSSSKYCQSNSQIHQQLFWRSGQYYSMRYCQWKYQISSNPKKIWLYDILQDPQEKNNLAELSSSDPFISELLAHLSQVLHNENSKQVKPIWESLSETPVLVDKIFKEQYVEGDEYIYWSN